MKKLLVFAHTPPPHHGQSYMVQLFLEGATRGHYARSLQIYHVNARFASRLDDIGQMRFGKILLLLKYCAQAIWHRLRHGVKSFYYVPANPSRSTVYRDWMLMSCCRLFFPEMIFHWHAAGLGEWLDKEARPWERWVTERLLGHPTLSIVLSEYSRRDGERLKSRKTVVVPNGIPDPCPEWSAAGLGRPNDFAPTQMRPRPVALRTKGPEFRVLFLGLCTREKGLFDAIEAIELANRVEPGFRLVVAGTFRSDAERSEFDCRTGKISLVEYRGFVSGDEKRRLFNESDCFCFPTYYSAESFGLVLLEAMAFDLPVAATRWRMIPEVLPAKYPYLVEPQAPKQLAEALLRMRASNEKLNLREHFLQNFTAEKFIARMESALLEAGTSGVVRK